MPVLSDLKNYSKEINDGVPVTFTREELWLCNDFIRHDIGQLDTWEFPPVDLELNEEIALAIHVCTTCNIKEYTLLLNHTQLLAIDFCIRRDMNTPEGATGKDILLKTFAARAKLTGMEEATAYPDLSYKEVLKNAPTNPNSSPNPDDNPNPKSDS